MLLQIGRVRAPWQTTESIPAEGGPASIEVAQEFEPALRGIERASHLVVIAYLHKADRAVLEALSRKLGHDAPVCGVFATRSPSRPNPLSVTMVELVRCDGLVLHVSPLDLLDATPVVDLKAYSPGWDSVFAARTERRVSSFQLPDSVLIPFLQRDLRNHMGDLAAAPWPQAALRAVVRAVRVLAVDPRDPLLCMEVNGCGMVVDALMGMTGALFASGRIAVVEDGGVRRVRFVLGDRRHVESIE